MAERTRTGRARWALVAAGAVILASGWMSTSRAEEESEPAEIALGERLFLETRFSRHFFERSGSHVNAQRVPGEPVVAKTVTVGRPLPGPFRGEAMNCRACHLVDEQGDDFRGGVRTYADFARRSPVPDRGDGLTVTLRNSPSLVDASRAFTEDAPLLHFDGEFATPEDLVVGTFTGRNFGWLPGERDEAIAHIARVLREDVGSGELAEEFGGSYRDVLEGRAHDEFRLPPAFRVDVARATDEELVRAAARLVGAYLRSLHFGRDGLGRPVGSSWDHFLADNGLPRKPADGESPREYSDRLRSRVEALRKPRFVSRRGVLHLHDRLIRFGGKELKGLRIFMTRPEDAPEASSGVGNCVACHVPPNFTDRGLRNTGVSQFEYDAVHGAGAFLALEIPDLAARDGNHDAFLPASEAHPAAPGPFAAIPAASAPGLVDLGLWNVFRNPDRPAAQDAVRAALTRQFGSLPDGELLQRTVAAFKTPSLRDLGQSGPYMHDGSRVTLGQAVRLYRDASELARQGKLRNADPALAGIRLSNADAKHLVAFLMALDEDYE